MLSKQDRLSLFAHRGRSSIAYHPMFFRQQSQDRQSQLSPRMMIGMVYAPSRVIEQSMKRGLTHYWPLHVEPCENSSPRLRMPHGPLQAHSQLGVLAISSCSLQAVRQPQLVQRQVYCSAAGAAAEVLTSALLVPLGGHSQPPRQQVCIADSNATACQDKACSVVSGKGP